MAKALEKRAGDVYLGHRAIILDGSARQVTFSNGTRFRYDLLVNTIPLPELVRIAVDAPEEIHDAAALLRANSIRVMNLGIGRANITDKHWVHFPEKDVSFFRVSFPSNFSTSMTPAGTSSVSAEVSYTWDSPPDSGELSKRVIEDLVRVGILRPDDEILVRHTYDIRYAYCIYDKHRKKAMRTIRNWLNTVNVVTCGRFGLWTYFWSDEAINNGKTTGEKVLKRMKGASIARGIRPETGLED